MKLTAIACLALSLLNLLHVADAQSKPPVATLSASDRQHIMQDTFVVSRTTAAIPDSVKRAMTDERFEPTFLMAEPGQPYNSSDMGVAGVPWQRLVFVANNANYCIVHYEHGGFVGGAPNIAIFRIENSQAHWLENVYPPVTLPELQGVRLMLEPEQTRQHMMQDTFIVSRTVAAIPKSVKQEFARRQQEAQFDMAEPRDTPRNSKSIKGRPAMRLVFVALSDVCCVVHYAFNNASSSAGNKYEGFAFTTGVSVFRLSGDKAYLVYDQLGRKTFTDMTDLRWHLRSSASHEPV